ncbi:MAG TPA: TRAP transporter large permease [Dehalococcoidales bacterium]|nr:TRAP transporter large permease [Dehalococcoidales bacterium]
MSPEVVGIIGLAVLIVLLFLRMWIGFAMAFVGFFGYAFLEGFKPAFGIVGTVPYSTVAFYPVTVVPLFILMGVIVANTGVSGDLYNAAYKWVGHLRGGLAMATILACAGFAAITGSSSAGAVTMGKVALPEMKRYQYDDSMATGCVASGGTLGILIPPSLGFILYGILTEQSVGMLFMAGILPGLLLTALFIITIVVITARRPQAGPPGPKTGFKEKVISLKQTWQVLVLFLLVLGGIYLGVFTPTEAGAVGAFGAILITLLTRRLTSRIFVDSILDAGLTTAMVLMLLIGAFISMRFLAVTKLPFLLAETIGQLQLSPYALITAITIFYLIVGMFLDIFSGITLTLPIIYPTITALGFDPIWFGVLMVLVMEMGLVTPPVGLNVFVLAGVTDVPLSTIFRGVLPFVAAMIICVIIITLFPEIALFIPSMM